MKEQFADNVKKHELLPDGTYTKKKVAKGERFSCQNAFMAEAREYAKKAQGKKNRDNRRFIPMESEGGTQ